MPKYKRIPDIIEVEIYKIGMEDGWSVDFSGNMFSYYKEFETKQECLEFIQEDKGKLECDFENIDFEVIYEEPVPFIITYNGNYDVKEGDAIIIGDKGKRLYIIKKDIFEKTYELIEE